MSAVVPALERLELMRRHRNLIALAKAKGQGLDVEPVPPAPKTLSAPQKSSDTSAKKDLSSFLDENKGKIQPEQQSAARSTELTVATAESSDSEADPFTMVLHEQEARMEHLRKVIAGLESEAQAKHMSRDKAGALVAMRGACSKRATLAREEFLFKKLQGMEEDYHKAPDSEREHRLDSLKLVLANGEVARSEVVQIKIADALLLEEIREMIHDM